MRTAELLETPAAGVFVRRVLPDTGIGALVRVGAITREQHDAAERLAGDWLASGIGGTGTSWYGGGSFGWRGGRYESMTAAQERNWRRYVGAMRAMPLAAAREVAAVAIREELPTDLCRLRQGLDALCRHYGSRSA